MTDTLLNKISKHSNNTIITDAWLTGRTGEIVDIKGDCAFRFIDFIIDNDVYHMGASVKDMGKSLCAVTKMCITPQEIIDNVTK